MYTVTPGEERPEGICCSPEGCDKPAEYVIRWSSYAFKSGTCAAHAAKARVEVGHEIESIETFSVPA